MEGVGDTESACGGHRGGIYRAYTGLSHPVVQPCCLSASCTNPPAPARCRLHDEVAWLNCQSAIHATKRSRDGAPGGARAAVLGTRGGYNSDNITKVGVGGGGGGC